MFSYGFLKRQVNRIMYTIFLPSKNSVNVVHLNDLSESVNEMSTFVAKANTRG